MQINNQDMGKVIESTDVKNAVELFDKDWMVLAAGKEGDFNAMAIRWGRWVSCGIRLS